MFRPLFLLILLSCSLVSFSQSQISGVVNTYQEVITIDSMNQSIGLLNNNGFKTGDLVLIIQMQGATIDESLSNTFGTIQSYNSAGNYEFKRICQVEGSVLRFDHSFINAYDKEGSVQAIKVPEYGRAQLVGNLFADPWNGKTGGVLAIKADSSINLNAMNIDVSGLGFKGGAALQNGSGCLPVSLSLAYTDKNSGDDRALKGEGIAKYIAGKECSRGPQANGGGGGNNHNGGGSGGSNAGTGGAGGERIKYSTLACGAVSGLDSKPLTTGIQQNKVFMGGGGGAGHGNNAGWVNVAGANGGGIIFILSDSLIDTGNIMANGDSTASNVESEGGGGGGAGGSIIIQSNFIDNNVFVSAYGGKGASVDNVGNQNCSGPGGGGGGGYIASNVPIVNTNVTGGKSGVTATATQSNCPVGGTNGAKDGTNGLVKTDLASIEVLDCNVANVHENLSSGQLLVYPNPTQGILILEANGNYVYSILDLHGKTIVEETNASEKTTISLENEGVYLLRVQHNSDVYFRRIVKY